MEALAWMMAGFFSGSIPFSLLVGKLARGVDIRAVGDRNPGAFNVFASAGAGWGILAMLLDWLKGALPVSLAGFAAGISGRMLVFVALAPILGHAYSPWLGGRGGKALAVTFGVWTGLTLAAGPLLLGLLFTLNYALWSVSGWAVILSMLPFGGFVWWVYGATRPELMGVWLGNMLLLAWKHRRDLSQGPQIRAGWLRWVRPSNHER